MRFPFRRGLAVALVSTEVAMAAVGAAWATERVELDDPAYGEVLNWIDAHYRLGMRQAETVRGDVDGDGIDDVVAIFNVHAGGASGEYQHMLVMKGTGTGYKAVGVREQIVGISPHDFVIGRGFVEYTGTIMGPTDPHCCPTTQQRFRVTVSAKGLSDSKPVKGPATAPTVTGGSTTQGPHPVSPPFPGVQPPPVPTVAPPRDAHDAESLSAFIAFVKATQPERLRRDDVLGRLGAAQIAAQNGASLNVPVMPDRRAPAVSVTPLRDGTTGTEWCREFAAQADGVPARWIGCHGRARAWHYLSDPADRTHKQ